MKNKEKSKEQIIEELRQRIRELERECKRKIEAMQESGEMTRTLLDAPTDSVFLIDAGGTIFAVNKTGAQKIGKHADKLIGSCIYDLFSSELAKYRKTQADKVFHSGKTIRFEENRMETWFDTVVYPVFDALGTVTKAAIVARDITERKKIGEALRESEQRYRELVETANDMIFVVDTKGNFIFTNKAFEKHLGFSDEEIKKINGFKLVHPEDLEHVKKQFARLIKGKGIENLEYRYRTKDGFYIHVLNNASPLFDSQGDVIAAVSITSDITKHKKAEELLKKQKKELSALAHVVAHGVKNYIASIRIYAQYLIFRKKYTEKYVQRIVEMTTKIDEFVTRQLELAEAGKVIGEPEKIDLNVLIDKVGKSHNIEIQRGKMPTITGDPRRLREVFHNLIDNAITHGGANKMEISSRDKKDGHVISVKDNGEGISEEDIDKIFDVGYSKTGTGFGLAIVKKIIEAHGGSISVKSELEKGAVFEILFPNKAKI